MPMSQIDMVILKQGGSSLQVCGGLEREDGKEQRPAQLYVVVRQGDVIATGPGKCDYGNPRWQLDVHVPEGPQPTYKLGRQLRAGWPSSRRIRRAWRRSAGSSR
jgi:hypothetical protein